MLRLIDVTKRYGRVVANDRVSLHIHDGEIVGLLGENGAGKSTLLSIVGGFTAPDSGSITIDDRPATIDSPRSALRCGVSVVHQHFALVPTFTVGEQLALAGWAADDASRALPHAISPEARIEDLALGERQHVEIARALASRPRVLLLDEPTSMLAPREVDDLFAQLRTIRETGTSIVLVTHKIREALALSDRILVLRAGRIQTEERRTEGEWKEGVSSRILTAMFDWDREAASGEVVEVPRSREVNDVSLRVDHLSTSPIPGRQTLSDISFTLGAGQRMAILGVEGQGQRELLEALAAYDPHAGAVQLHGGKGQEAAGRSAIGYITDDRIGEGAAAELDLSRNLVLKRQRGSRFARRGILKWRAIHESADHAIEEWGIEPSDRTQPLGALSGGNIQKVLLAREFARSPHLLIAANPAHGLDARTASFLWSTLSAFASGGRSVIFTTSDMGESRRHADVVSVLFRGRLSTPVPVSSIGDPELGEMMVSGW